MGVSNRWVYVEGMVEVGRKEKLGVFEKDGLDLICLGSINYPDLGTVETFKLRTFGIIFVTLAYAHIIAARQALIKAKPILRKKNKLTKLEDAKSRSIISKSVKGYYPCDDGQYITNECILEFLTMFPLSCFHLIMLTDSCSFR